MSVHVFDIPVKRDHPSNKARCYTPHEGPYKRGPLYTWYDIYLSLVNVLITEKYHVSSNHRGYRPDTVPNGY